jgi:hypothetical protein
MFRTTPSLAIGLLMIVPPSGQCDPHDQKEMKVSVHGPSNLQWIDAPASLPRGAKIAVLEGDPSKEGPFVFRALLPDGYRIPPHTHPKIERITVHLQRRHGGSLR